MKTLIIVDIQNDFLLPDGKLTLHSKDHDTKPLCERVAKFAKEFDGQILITRDTHTEKSCEFGVFPPHCIRSEYGWNVCDEILEAVKGKESVWALDKSSFSSPTLNQTLSLIARDEIHVVGVCTHICVHDVVGSLVNLSKEFWNIIPDITIHKDMVDDFDPEMASFALKRMTNLYSVKVV